MGGVDLHDKMMAYSMMSLRLLLLMIDICLTCLQTNAGCIGFPKLKLNSLRDFILRLSSSLILIGKNPLKKLEAVIFSCE